jgi:uncharacterized protein (DUF4415 family)
MKRSQRIYLNTYICMYKHGNAARGPKARLALYTRPKSLDRILNQPGGGNRKSRITTYLDVEIVDYFKKLAKTEGTGYQTLINDALRQIVDSGQKELEKEDLKNDLLKDKQFLRKLKSALSV